MTDIELIKKIKTLKKIEPNKDWVNFCYQRITEQEKRAEKEIIGQPEKIFGWLSWLRLQPARLVAIGLIMIFGLGGTVFASFSAGPGDLLYPVKLKAERIPLVLALKKEAKVRLQADLANKRVEEISKLTESRPLEKENIATTSAQIISVAKNLNKEILNAQKQLQELQKEDKIKAARVAQEITQKIEESEQILAQASQSFEGESKAELENALRVTGNFKAEVYSAQLEDPSYREELEAKKAEIASQIEELEGKELTEEQATLLKEAKELLESENPADIIKANQKVQEIERLGYPQPLEIQK